MRDAVQQKKGMLVDETWTIAKENLEKIVDDNEEAQGT
jgi:hypothetical protein